MPPLGVPHLTRRGRPVCSRFRHVTRRFGDKVAVDDVTLEIPQGQMVGIIGRSGAGKSTLLRMINRLDRRVDGIIEFDGVAVVGTERARRCATGSATAP